MGQTQEKPTRKEENPFEDHPPIAVDCDIKYECHAKPGLCLIFNQKTFEENLNQSERVGTDTDARDLLSFFQDTLQFDVASIHDNTKEEIIKRLEEVRSSYNLNEMTCVVVIMLSHGLENVIFAKDTSLNESELISPFVWENCPELKNKPKMFFLQKCNGGLTDEGIDIHDDYENGEMEKIPSGEDILVAYPSTRGFASFRRDNLGSIFINTLVRVFRENYQQQDVVTMLTLVNRLISEKFESRNDPMSLLNKRKQMPCFRSQLTKKVFFNSRPALPCVYINPVVGNIDITQDELIDVNKQYEDNSCGLCIIINQSSFNVNQEDVNLLENLFSQKLGFATYVWKDVSVIGFLQIFANDAVKKSLSKATSFVIVVLSQGKCVNDMEQISMADMDISIDHFVSLLNNEICPYLLGKPKLFFFQTSSPLDEMRKKEIQLDQSDDAFTVPKRIPIEADVLVAFSSVPRNETGGSPFVCALHEVFGSQHIQYDVVSMLTSINSIVARKISSNRRMSFFESRLTRQCFITKKGNKKPPPYLWRTKFVKDFQKIQKWIKPKISNYPIGSKPGRCIILYDHPDFRQYQETLRETFDELNFYTSTACSDKINLEKLIQQEWFIQELNNISCFVLVILSKNDYFNNSWSYFIDSKCPALRRKPKLCIRLIALEDLQSSIPIVPTTNDFLFMTMCVLGGENSIQSDCQISQNIIMKKFVGIFSDILRTHFTVRDVQTLFNMVRNKIADKLKSYGSQKYNLSINDGLTKNLHF